MEGEGPVGVAGPMLFGPGREEWWEGRGATDSGSLGLSWVPGDPLHPVPPSWSQCCSPPPRLLPLPSLPGTWFSLKLQQYLLRQSSLPSTFLCQLVAAHSAARTYLRERNFKLSLEEFKGKKTKPHYYHRWEEGSWLLVENCRLSFIWEPGRKSSSFFLSPSSSPHPHHSCHPCARLLG